MDEEGFFFFTDRLKRMINASGFKVWPAEVKVMLYQHPAVQECCIIAARDAYRGETVKAVIVKRSGVQASEDEVIKWAHDKMAAYKVPRIVEFVETLPKSAAGKVMWRVLQEREMGEVSLIGVGNGLRRPRPPNCTCGFPAYSAPVGGFFIEVGLPLHMPASG